MKRQLHIKSSSFDPIAIDLKENEYVTVYVENPVQKVRGGSEPRKPNIHIDGLRWTEKEHFHFGWREMHISPNEKITIEFKDGNTAPTSFEYEEKYIEPEMECSFCHRPKSKVNHLIDGGFLARICDDCVKLCQDLIDEKERT